MALLRSKNAHAACLRARSSSEDRQCGPDAAHGKQDGKGLMCCWLRLAAQPRVPQMPGVCRAADQQLLGAQGTGPLDGTSGRDHLLRICFTT